MVFLKHPLLTLAAKELRAIDPKMTVMTYLPYTGVGQCSNIMYAFFLAFVGVQILKCRPRAHQNQRCRHFSAILILIKTTPSPLVALSTASGQHKLPVKIQCTVH